MKRILIALAAGAMLLLAGCAGQQTAAEAPEAAEPETEEAAAFDTAALQADAEAVADALQQGDYAGVCARFDETMAAAVSEEALKAGWESTVANMGAYQSRYSVEGAEVQGYYSVDVTEAYENNGILIHLVYSVDGKIAGLQCTFADISVDEAPIENDAYTEIELTVTADPAYPLGATLTMPTGVENPAVVIFVHGSGASDRDENIYGNKPFADLAHGLAEQGIASLRYDKRHYIYPEAAADLSKVTLREETLDDVAAAITLMEQDGRVDASRVYVLGHSLGGMLTPAIAAEHPELAGVISMAGSLRPLWEIVYDQQQEAISNLDTSALSDADKATLDAQVAAIEADIATLRGDFTSLPADTLLMGIPVGYWSSLSEYCGMNFIDKLTMPMLILQGDADFQVYPDVDYPLWQQTLAGRDNVSFHLYEGLNHLMMPTQGKRDTSEYQVKSSVSPEVIQDIAAFIQ